jgi:hypothetical protein
VFRVLNFRYSLSTQLGLAPWGLDNLPGAGMMIYPNSSSILIRKIFMYNPFPEFAAYQQRPTPVNPLVTGLEPRPGAVIVHLSLEGQCLGYT